MSPAQTSILGRDPLARLAELMLSQEQLGHQMFHSLRQLFREKDLLTRFAAHPITFTVRSDGTEVPAWRPAYLPIKIYGDGPDCLNPPGTRIEYRTEGFSFEKLVIKPGFGVPYASTQIGKAWLARQKPTPESIPGTSSGSQSSGYETPPRTRHPTRMPLLIVEKDMFCFEDEYHLLMGIVEIRTHLISFHSAKLYEERLAKDALSDNLQAEWEANIPQANARDELERMRERGGRTEGARQCFAQGLQYGMTAVQMTQSRLFLVIVSNRLGRGLFSDDHTVWLESLDVTENPDEYVSTTVEQFFDRGTTDDMSPSSPVQALPYDLLRHFERSCTEIKLVDITSSGSMEPLYQWYRTLLLQLGMIPSQHGVPVPIAEIQAELHPILPSCNLPRTRSESRETARSDGFRCGSDLRQTQRSATRSMAEVDPDPTRWSEMTTSPRDRLGSPIPDATTWDDVCPGDSISQTGSSATGDETFTEDCISILAEVGLEIRLISPARMDKLYDDYAKALIRLMTN